TGSCPVRPPPPTGGRKEPPPALRTKRSDCSASAYTSRLRTSYSSSTRWNRTSRAFLLRRSGERRPRMPKPTKRDHLVEATKELLWEVVCVPRTPSLLLT